MNRTFFFPAMLFSVLPMFCMQQQEVQYASQANIVEKVDDIAQILTKDAPSDFLLDKIRWYLEAQKFSQQESSEIKNALVSLLSPVIVERFTISSARLLKSPFACEALVKIYLDGTRSEEGAKPKSPWHQLTFENFLRIYFDSCQAYNIKPGMVTIPERSTSPKA